MSVYVGGGKCLPLEVQSFTSRRARATFATLKWYPYYRIIEARVFDEDGVDQITVEISPELPQVKKNDIRYREPLALSFDHGDAYLPRVQALRKDFPLVPHLNLVPVGAPKELCLYT
jgi:hypothetical protein